MAKKSQKQKMQAMAAESKNAGEHGITTDLTQNEGKWNKPNVPSV